MSCYRANMKLNADELDKSIYILTQIIDYDSVDGDAVEEVEYVLELLKQRKAKFIEDKETGLGKLTRKVMDGQSEKIDEYREEIREYRCALEAILSLTRHGDNPEYDYCRGVNWRAHRALGLSEDDWDYDERNKPKNNIPSTEKWAEQFSQLLKQIEFERTYASNALKKLSGNLSYDNVAAAKEILKQIVPRKRR